ncbi:hypothetical protein BDW22DRAFT_764844 [Trametopsis cervina]|nr:hypothetical protein BDW22DRAFT_764844 [Trametopsis cervina]
MNEVEVEARAEDGATRGKLLVCTVLCCTLYARPCSCFLCVRRPSKLEVRRNRTRSPPSTLHPPHGAQPKPIPIEPKSNPNRSRTIRITPRALVLVLTQLPHAPATIFRP